MHNLSIAKRTILFGVIPVAALAAAYVYLVDSRYVSTDNAYVKTDIAAISPEVDGRVAKVLIDNNQMITIGDILFKIDRRPFEIAFAEAEAELASARQRIEAIRALYHQGRLEIVASDERTRFLKKIFDRQKQLKSKGFAAGETFEQAEHELAMARQNANVAKQRNTKVLAELSGDPQMPVEQHPLYLSARAKREQAALDLDRTVVRAPITGLASNVTLIAGEYVEAGEPVMALVGTERLWIEANLKEIKLTHLRVGLKAEIVVDAFPDSTWPATIHSISPATGAEFSLLPPQNATGNWVKVVQRVPVRLVIDPGPDLAKLRAGMSVRVNIDTERESDFNLLINHVQAKVPDPT